MNIIEARKSLVKQIRDFMGTRNAVIGESGGVDSALVTFLCVEALGENRVIARTMPYGEQSTIDADAVANILNISNYGCINIKPSVDSFGFKKGMTIGNAKARVRMINLYALAAENNGLVIGTSNKTEMMIGYFTKYGDGGCDVEPIADLFKTEVWEMAKTYLNFPANIIQKSPSAELWEGQTDEGEIGMSYSEMDAILRCVEKYLPLDVSRETQLNILSILRDLDVKFDDIMTDNYPNVSKIISMHLNTEHKRNMPKTFYLTKK